MFLKLPKQDRDPSLKRKSPVEFVRKASLEPSVGDGGGENKK